MRPAHGRFPKPFPPVFLLAALTLAACLAWGCGPAREEVPADGSPLEVGEGGGAGAGEVRVASLLPYASHAVRRAVREAALELGGDVGVAVVASVTATGEPTEEGVLDLGDSHSPSFEVLSQARPTLVVADGRLHGSLLGSLGQSGAEVVLLEGSSVEGTFEGLETVASHLGPEGSPVRAALEGEVAAARQEIAALHQGEGPAVLPLFGAPSAFLAITEATWLGDLLIDLGWDHLTAEATGEGSYPGYVALSDEVLATLEPDLVLLVTHGSPQEVESAFRRRAEREGLWGTLADRTRVLEPELFAANPGLRLPEAARRLVEISREVGGDEAPR